MTKPAGKPPSLGELAQSVLTWETSLQDALASVRAGTFDESEIHRVTEAVDGSSRPSDEEALVARLAWEAVDRVSDPRLRLGIALNHANSLLAGGMAEDALDVARTAEEWCAGLSDMRAMAVTLNLQANAHTLASHQDQAIPIRERVLHIAQEIDDRWMEAKEAIALGTVIDDADPAAAYGHLDHAVELARSAGWHDIEAAALVAVAHLARTHGGDSSHHLQQATAAALRATATSRELLDAISEIVNRLYAEDVEDQRADLLAHGTALAGALGDRAIECYFAGNLGAELVGLGDFEGAERHLKHALNLAMELGDYQGVAIARTNLARLEERRGAQAPTTPPPPERAAEPVAATINELAELAHDDEQHTLPDEEFLAGLPTAPLEPGQATEVVRRLLNRARSGDDEPRWIYALLELLLRWMPPEVEPEVAVDLFMFWAGYNHRLGSSDRAVEGYAAAAEMASEHGLRDQLISALTNLGTVLRQLGRTAEATGAYQTAMTLARQSATPSLLSKVLINASTVYTDVGRHREAADLAEEALALLTAAGSVASPEDEALLAICLVNYGSSLVRLGRFRDAEEHLERALTLNRHIGHAAQEGAVLGFLGLLRECRRSRNSPVGGVWRSRNSPP